MAKKIIETVKNSFDPFDILGGRKSDKKANQAEADRASALASAEKTKADAAAAAKTAADQKAAGEKDQKLEATAAQDESRRLALNDYLMQEGDTQSRRKFLVGAK